MRRVAVRKAQIQSLHVQGILKYGGAVENEHVCDLVLDYISPSVAVNTFAFNRDARTFIPGSDMSSSCWNEQTLVADVASDSQVVNQSFAIDIGIDTCENAQSIVVDGARDVCDQQPAIAQDAGDVSRQDFAIHTSWEEIDGLLSQMLGLLEREFVTLNASISWLSCLCMMQESVSFEVPSVEVRKPSTPAEAFRNMDLVVEFKERFRRYTQIESCKRPQTVEEVVEASMTASEHLRWVCNLPTVVANQCRDYDEFRRGLMIVVEHTQSFLEQHVNDNS